MRVKKGDTVIVISGKDKGLSGTVLRAMPANEQVLVEGVNLTKRHERARKRGSQGQVVEIPMPIHVSNVALKDERTGKAVRAGYTFEGEGDKRKKIRVVGTGRTKN